MGVAVPATGYCCTMARKKPAVARTWSEIGVDNAGIRDTIRALEFAMDWGMAGAVLGHEPESIAEFAEVAEVSRATAFRNQQAFRKAFPMLSGPTDLNERAGMTQAYAELVVAATDVVQARPLVIAKMFTIGAARADI